MKTLPITYLCDEGNDPVLKKFCGIHGIVHVTREKKTDAKAGNINNALKQAKGEICVILDPDHEPVPEFLDRTLPYFEDEKIGFLFLFALRFLAYHQALCPKMAA